MKALRSLGWSIWSRMVNSCGAAEKMAVSRFGAAAFTFAAHSNTQADASHSIRALPCIRLMAFGVVTDYSVLRRCVYPSVRAHACNVGGGAVGWHGECQPR